jgi:zinc protease
MIRILVALFFLTGPAFAAVNIEEVKTPGGITAWLVEEHSIPFAALEIRFRGGASLDAPGKRGAINLMTGLLDEGAGDLDSRAFSAAREGLAARIGFDLDDDSLSVSARFLTENRAEAVALLRTALTSPRFDPDAIERVRAQVLSSIRSDATDPDSIASTAFAHLAWGDHPYGSDIDGTSDSVTALSRDDLIEAKARVMARDRIYVGVVGDITAAELAPLLDDLLGGLPASGAPMPPKAEVRLKPGTTVIPFDSPQSVAIFGEQGIALHDPDYFAAYLVNQILGGGGFASRLMDEIREKRGLTYGIGTGLANYDLGDLIMGQVASANGKMAETLDLVRSEWTRFARDGVTADELADAKTYLTGAYPLRWDGNSTIANILVGMQMDGLPIDYAATRNDKVNAVTLEDANRVAARLFRPEALGFVVVGQPEGVQSTAN